MRFLIRILCLLAIVFVCFGALVGCVQRRLLYFPSHDDSARIAAQSRLTPWEVRGEYLGFARLTPNPKRVWLVLHGNGGQAAQRGYILRHVDPADPVFVVEYPGYGPKPGSPSRRSFDHAALNAWQALVKIYGPDRLVVLGESLGSGPAGQLARASVPPKHIVLVVPFDRIIDVAQEKFRMIPVSLLMLDRWDNVAALKGYTGTLDIFGGTNDPVIPVRHARNLAAAIAGARYHEFAGGHNWADSGEVDLTKL